MLSLNIFSFTIFSLLAAIYYCCIVTGNIEGICIPKISLPEIDFCQDYLPDNICVQYSSVSKNLITITILN